jgi:hypothetical protein
MSEAKDAKKRKEPFPGAYYLAGAITIGLMLFFLFLGASLPPGVAGFLVAFVLGLTVNPKYVPFPFFLFAAIFKYVPFFLGLFALLGLLQVFYGHPLLFLLGGLVGMGAPYLAYRLRKPAK